MREGLLALAVGARRAGDGLADGGGCERGMRAPRQHDRGFAMGVSTALDRHPWGNSVIVHAERRRIECSTLLYPRRWAATAPVALDQSSKRTAESFDCRGAGLGLPRGVTWEEVNAAG